MVQEIEKQVKQIKEVLLEKGVFHSDDDVQKLVDITNQIYERGHEYSYVEVAQFITNEHNIKYVNERGLSRALDLVLTMKMPPIKRRKLPQRNATCICQSGKKFKNCCLPKLM